MRPYASGVPPEPTDAELAEQEIVAADALADGELDDSDGLEALSEDQE
ncbi:MAG: hypothetical protein KGL39_42260 [Patescibacteria group bacterium]|nr:hypothetical protein [Patescibacteria group bacterium]